MYISMFTSVWKSPEVDGNKECGEKEKGQGWDKGRSRYEKNTRMDEWQVGLLKKNIYSERVL